MPLPLVVAGITGWAKAHPCEFRCFAPKLVDLHVRENAHALPLPLVVAGIGRAGVSQFRSGVKLCFSPRRNEGALTPELWKARFLFAERSRSRQKATRNIRFKTQNSDY